MKTRFFLTLICLFFVSGASHAKAEILELGFLSPLEMKNLTQDATIKLGDSSFPLLSSEITSWIKSEDSLVYSPNYLSEMENTHFCSYKKSFICALSFSNKKEKHIQKKTLADLDTDSVSAFLSAFAKKNNKQAENARFKLDGGKVAAFSTGSEGFRIDEEKSLAALKDFIKNRLSSAQNSNEVTLPIEVLKPDTPIESVDSMGIDTLIGEGRSNFRGSPRNRIANIKVAIQRFNGVLIKPKEEFSFVKTLGDVDEEHGYFPELVIKKDKTEPEFGGGICQVSTTAFRAAIYSGLEVTVRRNHAYPVSYYNPQGMDSTVYVPKPDLKFINNTPGYILIQPRIEGTELIFDFYGTTDGRKTNIIGPTILEKNPDGSMKTTFTQQVIDKDGNTVREDVFNSNYDSPDKYPHPAPEGTITEKPKNWSDREWKQYKKEHNLP